MSWYLGRVWMCFRNLAKTPVPVVCLKGGRKNSIFSGGCSSWVRNKCNGILGPLKPDHSFKCKQCTGQMRWTVDGRPMTEVTVGRGEAWGDAILLLPRGLFILMWWLWTRFHHKMPCGMGQIQRAPARPHLPLISHHLQKILPFVQAKPGPQPYLNCIVRNAMTDNDLLDVLCHRQGPSQLASPPGKNVAWWSGKGTLHVPTQKARPCRT